MGGRLRIPMIIRLSQLSLAGVGAEAELSNITADLEKVASGANGACGHFVGNPAILRHFQSNIPYFCLRIN